MNEDPTSETVEIQPSRDDRREARRQELRDARRQVRRARRRLERRHADIDELKAQIEVLRMETVPLAERQASTSTATPDGLETDRGMPSFSLSQRMHRRLNTKGVYRRNDVHEPILDLSLKDAGRQFAAAHGVRVPAVHGEWSSPDDIEWDALPDRFVIKSNRGGGGINVFPVERREGGFYDFIGAELVTAETITQRFWKKHQEGSIYFAEEFLVGRDGETMPDDIKVFCFYGEPAFIEVRTEAWSRRKEKRLRQRTFLVDGTEIFNARALIPYGDDVVAPVDFAAVREASSTLSAAIRRPVQRLDFYETDSGLVFGEVTQNPGWPPALVRYWDRRFGETYEEASARLITDLVDEGHLGLEYGDEPVYGEAPAYGDGPASGRVGSED